MTKIFLNAATAISFVAISICCFGQGKTQYAQSIEGLLKGSKIARSELGLLIADRSGSTIFELNADRLFIPASLSKIMTGAAALTRFPLGHQFLTSVYLKGTKLYLVGGGDAGFTSESMWVLVNELMRSRLPQEITEVVVDDSLFDSVRYDSSREKSRVDRAYDAPIGAMTFNWSAINIFVRPSEKAGQPASVFADPENAYIKVVGSINTTSGAKNNLAVTNAGRTRDGSHEIVNVSGTIGTDSPEQIVYRSVEAPDLWAGHQFVGFLRQRGIQVANKVMNGKKPADAVLIATHKGQSVTELVTGMMKFSNNYIAEILTKNMGTKPDGSNATLADGVDAINDFMRSEGLRDFSFVNPSGLTRRNKLSPRHLQKILHRMQNNFSLFPEFIGSMPISGVDGTLRRRINRMEERGLVRAKTGNLNGVVGLSGYFGTQRGDIWTFAFIFNGDDDDESKAKQLFDSILGEGAKIQLE